jgi:hypothetical protein
MKKTLTAAYVCFSCRKVFKKPSFRLAGQTYEPVDQKRKCPQCDEVLVRVGDTFRAPKKSDPAKWELLKKDLDNGRTFVRDEKFGVSQKRKAAKQTPKGLRSIFQIPARKRKRAVLPA